MDGHEGGPWTQTPWASTGQGRSRCGQDSQPTASVPPPRPGQLLKGSRSGVTNTPFLDSCIFQGIPHPWGLEDTMDRSRSPGQGLTDVGSVWSICLVGAP